MTAIELGATLRAWRDRVQPTDVRLPVDGPRRVSGLRREELAELARISVDYLVRLEQGRATPSPQVLGSLAHALRVDSDERRHLFRLAGLRAPERSVSSPVLTDSVLRLLDRRPDDVIGVYDAAWTLRAWTPLFAALLGDPSALTERECNVLWSHFAGRPSAIEHTADADDRFERAVVADLRAAAAHFPTDEAIASLVRDLYTASDRFAQLWASHEVGAHVSDTKTVHHTQVGPIMLECDVFTVPGSDARVVMFSPPDNDAAIRLALVRAIGVQQRDTRPDSHVRDVLACERHAVED